MPDGGIVTISTQRRDLGDPEKPDPWICLSVVDEGTGIPENARSNIFDPFYTTKPVGSGTGLGLAMVKGFVIQSGGRVSLQSEEGTGTTIEIELPEAVEQAPKPASGAAVAQPRGGSESILLVEDDAAVAAVGFRILSLSGYRVLLADCAGAALTLLRSHKEPIELFLVDVMRRQTRRGPFWSMPRCRSTRRRPCCTRPATPLKRWRGQASCRPASSSSKSHTSPSNCSNGSARSSTGREATRRSDRSDGGRGQGVRLRARRTSSIRTASTSGLRRRWRADRPGTSSPLRSRGIRPGRRAPWHWPDR